MVLFLLFQLLLSHSLLFSSITDSHFIDFNPITITTFNKSLEFILNALIMVDYKMKIFR